MDATVLSAKSPQALVLTSCTTLLSSAKKARTIRGEFLGCGYNFQLPGGSVRSRRKCKRFGLFQFKSPRFLVRASLNYDPTLVVVAVTAVYIALFNYYYRKRKDSTEVADSPGIAVPHLHRHAVDHVIESEVLDFGDHLEETSANASQDLMEKMEENKIPSQDEEAHLHVQKATSMCDDSLLTKSSDSLGVDSVSYGDSDNIFLIESEAISAPLPFPGLPQSGAMQPLMFATDMSKLPLEKGKQETGLEPELPRVTVTVESGASSVLLDDPLAVDVEENWYHNHVDVGELTSFTGVLKASSREDIYTFYGANQPVMKSPSFNDLKAVGSPSSRFKSNSFSSLKRGAELKGAEQSAKNSHQTADDVEEKVPLACYKEGPSHTTKVIRRDRRFSRDKERKHLTQDSHKSMEKFRYSNEVLAGEDHPSDQFSAYNCLLRDGRLTDCIDLLEDMEKRGLLDMNKIYHTRFFKICRSQKAAKEAFRFSKLIPNPTLSTFNMLMSVCASSQDSEGAFQVLQLVQEAGMKADCKLYTTLISTCAKSGKVDAMFEVFHEMVNSGVEPNVHTYGALIDGCARVGQVAKAFGAYGIMRAKKVKPDRVVFNALITACGQSGAVDRAFDVLSEMGAETQPVDPDHVTIGALIKACSYAGQVDRAQEVYKMIDEYNIKGTPEVYTIAINCCSQTGDWDFARSVYTDMKRKGIVPDEVFLSALIDAAGHAGKVDAAFEILQEARIQGIHLGVISYSSLMGACSNAKNWQKALELYDNIKSIRLNPTVSTMNALITALCDGDQLPKAMEILSEMKSLGLTPNIVTYSMLLVASEKKDDLEVALTLLAQAKVDGIAPNLTICRCIVGMCLQRYEKACILGEPVLSFNSGRPQIENKWTSMALMVYRETILGGTIPTMEVVSQVLGCLWLPCDASLRNRLIESLGVSANSSRHSTLCSLVDGFGEYDPRAFSLLEEAASLGIVPCVSFKESPIVVDARKLHVHTAKVYLLTVFKGLKHRLAAGARLPNINVLLPVEKTQIASSDGEKTINLAGTISQAIGALLRRLGVTYHGNESYGKIRINGLSLRRWFQPKLASPFTGRPEELNSSQTRLGKGIIHQQRNIRTGNLSLD